MGLSIQGTGDQNLHALQKTQDDLMQGMRRLATGKRIATAADDAAGLAIAQRLAAIDRSMAQGERNLQDGDSMAATAAGALAQQSELLQRMRQLSVQAQNGTLSSADRVTIQQEYDQLSEQMTMTSAGAAFGDRPLLDGSLTGTGSVDLNDGRAVAANIDLPDHSAAALGVDGWSVGDPATLDAIDQAIDRVSQTRAHLGATQNRLGHQIDSVRNSVEQTATARSRIEDADIAYEVAERTRNELLTASSVALQSHSRNAESMLSQLIV
jgi:flagellin